MTDLATLATAYPDSNPWFDLRPYLVNGWTPLSPATCGVSVTPNVLFYSIRVVGTDATHDTFMEGIPLWLRGVANSPLSVFLDTGVTVCDFQRSTGNMRFIGGALALVGGTVAGPGTMNVMGTIPRGTPV